MRTVVLVPYRAGSDALRIWSWDVTRWFLQELDLPIYTGEPPFKEWARSHAVNAAAAAAGDWDVAVIVDADTIVEPASIHRAVNWVKSTGGAARPHHERWMLTKEGSLVIAQRGPDALEPKHHGKRWGGGGALVLTREAWDMVGGFDERFIGWGHEDSAMNLALLECVQWDRLPGNAWHLWHPPAGAARRESTQLYQQILRQHKTAILNWAADKGLKNPMEIF